MKKTSRRSNKLPLKHQYRHPVNLEQGELSQNLIRDYVTCFSKLKSIGRTNGAVQPTPPPRFFNLPLLFWNIWNNRCFGSLTIWRNWRISHNWLKTRNYNCFQFMLNRSLNIGIRAGGCSTPNSGLPPQAPKRTRWL